MAVGTSPRVSVGLPVYNGARHIVDAVDSILGQTFSDFELIISDNASTDATPEICREYARTDGRVRYYRNPTNRGALYNFARVFDLARGEYFKWAAHDDVLAPTFLARCVGRLDADPRAVLCATKIDVVDDGGALMGRSPDPIAVSAPTAHGRLREFFAQPKTHQTVFGVIRRETLSRTRLFGSWYGSDRSFLMELTLFGGFARVDEPLFLHREHDGRSDRASSTMRWMTPDRGERPVPRHWRHLADAGRMLMTTPLGARERLLCLAEYGRRGRPLLRIWAPMLGRESMAIIGHAIHSLTGRA